MLIHGFPEYWEIWRNQIEVLAENHLVIVPDLPGINLSCAPGDEALFTAERISVCLMAMLSAAGIRKAAFAGHDIGGMIAWYCAGRFPDRVDRLALLSSPHPADFLKARIEAGPSVEPDYIDLILAGNDDTLMQPERLSYWLAGSPHQVEFCQAMERSDLKAFGHYYRASLRPAALTAWSELPPAGCPTLVIYGDRDPYVRSQHFLGIRRQVVGNLTICKLADQGHFLHSTAAGPVNEALRSWLAQGQ